MKKFRSLLFVFLLLTNFSISSAQKYPDFCEVFTREIYRGRTGEDILELQKVLITEGHKNVTASGIFGFQSAEAIRKIQTQNGLYPFGKIGPDTFKLLKNLWCAPDPLVETDMDMDIFPVENKAGNITVEWQTQNAVSCMLDGQNVTLNGTKKYQIQKKQNLYLVCIDQKNQSVRKKLKLEKGILVGKTPKMTVSISKTGYEIGEQLEIKIQSEGAETCTINKKDARTNGSSFVTVKVPNEKYEVVCQNKGKKVSRILGAGEKGDIEGIVSFEAVRFGNDVKVNCINKRENFSQSSKRIFGTDTKGTGPCDGNVYITWRTHDVKSCVATGPGFRDKNSTLFGGENITVDNARYDYKLTCVKNDGLVFEKELIINPQSILTEDLDLSIVSDKSTYQVGEKIRLTLNAKNNTGRDVFYFNSFPCVAAAPFAIYFNGRNYEEIFGEQKNICKTKAENLEFSFLANGQSINKEFELELPKNVTSGDKKIRVLLGNNLYGISGVPKEIDIKVGQPVSKNFKNTEEVLGLVIETDKKVYQKGDTLVVTLRYRNETAYTIKYKENNCSRYEGNLIFVNGMDMYDYFNSYSQQVCNSPKVIEFDLKPGEETFEIYRAFIDPKKTYLKDDLKLTANFERSLYLTKSEPVYFRIVDDGTTVNLQSDGKPVLNKNYKISWINGRYGNSQGVLLELARFSSTSKLYEVVGTIKKIPEGDVYYTTSGEFVWNIPTIITNDNSSSVCSSKVVDGVCNVKVEPSEGYKIKATFFDNRLACFGKCDLNIKPNILGSVFSEEFAIQSPASITVGSGQISLVSKLGNYVKVRVIGECGQANLEWGDGQSSSVNLVKNQLGVCENFSTHTYSPKGIKNINYNSSSGQKSSLEVNID